MGQPCKVIAELAAPLVGEAPMIEALLEWEMAERCERIERTDRNHRHSGFEAWRRQCEEAPGYEGLCSRNAPAPPPGALPICIERADAAGWPVARASAPILAPVSAYVEHRVKRLIGAEAAEWIGRGRRQSIHHGTGATRAYYRPLTCRAVTAVVWFVVAFGARRGNERDGRSGRRRNPATELHRRLRTITAIGSNRSAGYGAVSDWRVETIETDWSWFADSPEGPVLMRPLPVETVPAATLGWRPGCVAVCPPFWHPERRTEAAIPC